MVVPVSVLPRLTGRVPPRAYRGVAGARLTDSSSGPLASARIAKHGRRCFNFRELGPFPQFLVSTASGSGR